MNSQQIGMSQLREFMGDYGRAWDAADLDKIVAAYTTPCFVQSAGRLHWNLDEDDKRSFFQELLESYQRRGCRAITPPEFEVLAIQPTGSDRALITVRWVCRGEAEDILSENTDSYLCARLEERWRIIGAAAHE
jgi:hypothetical protein